MVIGIDVDGVIQDSENWFRSYAEIYDIENGGKGMVLPHSTKVETRYGWDRRGEMLKFMHRYGFDVERNAPLLPAVRETLVELKKMGHTLVVVTARGTIDPLEEEIAFERLNREGLPLDKILVRCFDKLSVCRDNGVDVMIDDSPENIKLLSNGGIKCLYMRSLDCEDIIHSNVVPVRNWGEVLRYFANQNQC